MMNHSTQKKILLVTPLYPPDIGGPATYAALMTKYLPARGFDVEVLSFGLVRHLPKVLRHGAFFFKILWQGRGTQYIFAQDPVSVGFPALCASFLLRSTFVIRVPGDYAWEQSVQRYGVQDTIDEFQTKRYGFRVEFLRSIQRFVVSHASIVIAPSKYFSRLMSTWGNDPISVTPIYNGIDFSAIPASPIKEKEGKVLFSSGRLVPWKGFEVLITMMQALPQWRLRIAGEGPEYAQLLNLITTLNLTQRVELLGQVSRERIFQELSTADVFVLNTSFESFSYQVVEAMMVGVPVITTNIGNLSEIITDGQEGFLVAPNDSDQIQRIITQLETNTSLRERIVINAKKKAENFSIEKTMDQVASLLP